MKIYDEIIQATVEGDLEQCTSLAQKVIDQGLDPVEALQQGFSQGMEIVGEKFTKMEYFLPEVIFCADAMKAAVEVLKPHFGKGKEGGDFGTIVLGTMQGDIHDLGKNIVSIMLESSGFTIYDLGSDVNVRRFIEKAEEVNADIIAVSAILTTTMSYMPELINLLDEIGERGKYRIMVGGAPVTQDFADHIGADGYGENATDAVYVAKQLFGDKRKGEQND